MAHVPSLFVHPDYGIVFLKKSGNVILLTLLKGNLRHTFLRVHISVSFTMFLLLLLLLFFGTFEALLDIVIKSSPI